MIVSVTTRDSAEYQDSYLFAALPVASVVVCRRGVFKTNMGWNGDTGRRLSFLNVVPVVVCIVQFG